MFMNSVHCCRKDALIDCRDAETFELWLLVQTRHIKGMAHAIPLLNDGRLS